MITITLMGGLGNQMFQYALGLALEMRGRHVCYDASRLAIGNPHGPHNRHLPDYGLDGFNTHVEFGASVPPRINGGVGYNPEILNTTEGTLTGYWQSEKYFLDIGYGGMLGHPVVHAFFPAVDPSKKVSELVKRVYYDEGVIVQVRRGDYVQFADFHGVMDRDYFMRGIEATGKKNVFVITDDEPWCRENIPGEIVNTGSRHWDMLMMSGAHSMVISNSTFGWWGAWLGDFNFTKPDRKVIAPKKWFATEVEGVEDIVPSRWTRI